MKQIGLLATDVLCATLVLPRLAAAQTAPAIPPSNTTPHQVETRIGTLSGGYAFTLAVYVAHVGGPAVIAIVLWYVLERTD